VPLRALYVLRPFRQDGQQVGVQISFSALTSFVCSATRETTIYPVTKDQGFSALTSFVCSATAPFRRAKGPKGRKSGVFGLFWPPLTAIIPYFQISVKFEHRPMPLKPGGCSNFPAHHVPYLAPNRPPSAIFSPSTPLKFEHRPKCLPPP
jgi:hypothetical protein